MTARKELTKVVDSLPDLNNINILDLVVYFLPVFEKVEILEESERLKMAAISGVSLCNTEKSLGDNVLSRDNPYWTVAFDDVARAMRREIKLLAKEEIYEKYMTLYADKNNWYGQDLASSEGRHARECIEKIKAIDKENK